MSLTGDFAALTAFKKRAEALGDVRAEVARRAAPRLQELARAAIAAGLDPYGAAHRPTRRGRPPFVGTGAPALCTVTASGNAIVCELGMDHLDGRDVIPVDGRGIPPTWRAVLEAVTREVMNEKTGLKK